MLRWITGIFFVATLHCQAEVIIAEKKIAVEKGGVAHSLHNVQSVVANRIVSHIHEDTSGMDQYMTCTQTIEIPHFYICVAFWQADLNNAFTRAGIFMGAAKGIPKGTILKDTDWTLINYKKLVAGHNLPGSTVLAFYQAAKDDSHIQLNTMENQLHQALMTVPDIKENKHPFYIVGISVQSTKSQESVVSHEIFHAQYLLTPNYKAVVNRFWKEKVSAADKKKIKDVLGKAYNTEDYILIDEFQAYLLQDHADRDLLKDFVSYRAGLEKALENKGVKVVRVDVH